MEAGWCRDFAGIRLGQRPQGIETEVDKKVGRELVLEAQAAWARGNAGGSSGEDMRARRRHQTFLPDICVSLTKLHRSNPPDLVRKAATPAAEPPVALKVCRQRCAQLLGEAIGWQWFLAI